MIRYNLTLIIKSYIDLLAVHITPRTASSFRRRPRNLRQRLHRVTCAGCLNQFARPDTARRHLRTMQSSWIKLQDRLKNLQQILQPSDVDALNIGDTTNYWTGRFEKAECKWYSSIDRCRLDVVSEQNWTTQQTGPITWENLWSRLQYMIDLMTFLGGHRCEIAGGIIYDTERQVYVEDWD